MILTTAIADFVGINMSKLYSFEKLLQFILEVEMKKIRNDKKERRKTNIYI